MFHYRNEAAFSNAFVKHLRNYGWFVQRIESGTTGRGIPDIYCVSPQGNAFWFELKRVHTDFGWSSHKYKIPWRPGQQAWLHCIHSYKQQAYTLCCYNNVIVVIPHNKMYEEDSISCRDVVERWYKWSDVVK